MCHKDFKDLIHTGLQRLTATKEYRILIIFNVDFMLKWYFEYVRNINWLLMWHPTPVLLPGKSHGQRSLVGYSPWVSKSGTWLSNFTFTFHFHALEQEMATHSSVLAWRIPGTGEPGGLPSMGLHRVGHNWCDLAAAAATLNEVITVNLPLTLEIFWVYWELLLAVTIFFAMILVLM